MDVANGLGLSTYHVWNTMLGHYQTHDKVGQRNAEIKDYFVVNAEWFASQVHW